MPQVFALRPVELFVYADTARDAGDFATAETAYRALAANPNIELRTEARFRLAMVLGVTIPRACSSTAIAPSYIAPRQRHLPASRLVFGPRCSARLHPSRTVPASAAMGRPSVVRPKLSCLRL